MEKYYYTPNKQEVYLGDTIVVNGMKVVITPEIIKMNPDSFEQIVSKKFVRCILGGIDADADRKVDRIYRVSCEKRPEENPHIYFGIKNWFSWLNDYDAIVSINYEIKDRYFVPATEDEYQRQCLLDKAIADYPKGTVVNFHYLVVESGWQFDKYQPNTIIAFNVRGVKIVLYTEGCWGEILQPIFKTADNVLMYKDQQYFRVTDNGLIEKCHTESSTNQIHDERCFSSVDAAKKFLANNPVYNLEYYEKELNKSDYYRLMKQTDIKLYYTKILLFIADKLNGNNVPDFMNSKLEKYYIYYCYPENKFKVSYSRYNNNFGVYFTNGSAALRTIEIMGDKLQMLL